MDRSKKIGKTFIGPANSRIFPSYDGGDLYLFRQITP